MNKADKAAVLAAVGISALTIIGDAIEGRTQAGEEPWQDGANQLTALTFAGSSQSVILVGDCLQAPDPTTGKSTYAPGPGFFEHMSRTATSALSAYDTLGIQYRLGGMIVQRRSNPELISHDVILQRLVEYHRRKLTLA